jgi:hypothetical protein
MKYKKDRPCPKCGEEGATSTSYGSFRIQRHCLNCDYYWNEEPLDSDSEDKERP